MTKPEPSDDALRSLPPRAAAALGEEVVEELLERRAFRHARQGHAFSALDGLRGRDIDHRVDQLFGQRRNRLRADLTRSARPHHSALQRRMPRQSRPEQPQTSGHARCVTVGAVERLSVSWGASIGGGETAAVQTTDRRASSACQRSKMHSTYRDECAELKTMSLHGPATHAVMTTMIMKCSVARTCVWRRSILQFAVGRQKP